MIDLRQEFNSIIRKWGHDVYLQRWRNNHYEEGLEKYTVRYFYPRSIGLVGAQLSYPEGIISDSELLYFFQWDANPSEGDRIYEEDPRFASNFAMWKIKGTLAMRGRGGRIEYWVCGVNREQPT